jgi:hypothetical protein
MEQSLPPNRIASSGGPSHSAHKEQTPMPFHDLHPRHSLTLSMYVLSFVIATLAASAQTAIDASEFQARRKAALDKVPDGIILLHSSSGLKHWEESGFHQDPNFY